VQTVPIRRNAVAEKDQDFFEKLKVLQRIPNGGLLFGVCAGIAYTFNLPTWLVRLAWLALFFFGGSGVLLYIICVVLMPERARPRNFAKVTGG
jgi:phage shock protein C